MKPPAKSLTELRNRLHRALVEAEANIARVRCPSRTIESMEYKAGYVDALRAAYRAAGGKLED